MAIRAGRSFQNKESLYGFANTRMRGKTMRVAKDGEGKAGHVLAAFCGGLQTVLGHEGLVTSAAACRRCTSVVSLKYLYM
jgi:hypothetical protein